MQPEQLKEQSQPSCSWPADGSADCSRRSLTAAGRSIHPVCALLLCQISLLSLSGFSFHFSVFPARAHNHFPSAQAGSKRISLGNRAGWSCSWCSKASSPGNCRGNPDLLRAQKGQAEQHLPEGFLGSAEQGSQSTQPSSLLPFSHPTSLMFFLTMFPVLPPQPEQFVHHPVEVCREVTWAQHLTLCHLPHRCHQSRRSPGWLQLRFPVEFSLLCCQQVPDSPSMPRMGAVPHDSAPAETPPQLPGLADGWHLCPATPEQAAGSSSGVL